MTTAAPKPTNSEPAAPKPEPLKPLFRYTGGKRRVMPAIDAIVRPNGSPLVEPGQRYYEPMIGAGASFCYWSSLGLIPKGSAVLGDGSPLIWQVWSCLIHPEARELMLAWLNDASVSREGFDAMKQTINQSVTAGQPLSGVEGEPDLDYAMAAAVTYVVRCSYGGLLRTNRAGQLNGSFAKDTPIKNPFGPSNLAACGRAAAEATSGRSPTRDYEEALVDASAGDFVYLDPPYYPESKTASFTGYTGSWDDDQHERLAATFDRLATTGVRVALSNSATDWVRQRYAAHAIHELAGHRANNRAVKERPRKVELLITANIPR